MSTLDLTIIVRDLCSLCYRNDIDIPDEENEEEIIRRQRLRREQLKQVRELLQPPLIRSLLCAVLLETDRKRSGR